MQVSRLTDEGRAIPWDQLVKRGVDESLGRCVTVLETTGGLPTRPVIDDYVSAVCNQLRTMESSPTAPRRSPVKSRRSAAQAPKLQSEVVVSSAGPSQLRSAKQSVGRQGAITDRGPVGSRTRKGSALWLPLRLKLYKPAGGLFHSKKAVTRAAPAVLQSISWQKDLY